MDTTTRSIITDWKVLADLVTKHSTPVTQASHEKDAEAAKPEKALLTHAQIDDALSGPYHPFFTTKLAAYAVWLRLKMHGTLEKESYFEDNPKEVDTLTKKQLESITPADLTKIRAALEKLTTQHNEQWENKVNEWSQALLMKLPELDVHLSELEVQEFMQEEPLSAIIDRFKFLNLELPKMKKGELDFKRYLTMKLDLAIESALARAQIPHEQKDIDKLIKKLKPMLDTVQKDEKQLINTQQKETNACIADIGFAVFK